ncbi:MAG: hypothetical protein J0I41_05145 [Filimonas sp.]|nr:hypothetical protein [Filimonas sp.]
MKKLLIAAVMLVAVATSAFAEGSNVSFKVKNQFASEFTKANNVAWTAADQFTKATFIMNEQRMEAYYDNDGELIGTSRATTLDFLPSKATKKIDEKYAGYKTEEVVEFDSVKDGLSYYVSLTNDTNKIVLQVSSEGSVSVYKKTSK